MDKAERIKKELRKNFTENIFLQRCDETSIKDLVWAMKVLIVINRI